MRLIICFISLISTTLNAHQDTKLSLEGSLITGLPSEYYPAAFNQQTWTLEIASNTFIFPQCAQSFFSENNAQPPKLKASWYHDTQTLPKYISINFTGIELQDIYFELDTLKPIPLSFGFGSTEEQLECMAEFLVSSAQ